MNELSDNLKQQISIAAYFLSKKNHPYDTLCWILAERQLYIELNFKRPEEEKIRNRAAKLFYSQPSYDILCWLISEINILFKNKIFSKNTKTNFNI